MNMASDKPNGDEAKPLPLEATLDSQAQQALVWGRSITLPVRRERVTVEKRPFVYEEAVIRTDLWERRVHLAEDVQREELSVEPRGDVEADTLRLDVTARPRRGPTEAGHERNA